MLSELSRTVSSRALPLLTGAAGVVVSLAFAFSAFSTAERQLSGDMASALALHRYAIETDVDRLVLAMQLMRNGGGGSGSDREGSALLAASASTEVPGFKSVLWIERTDADGYVVRRAAPDAGLGNRPAGGLDHSGVLEALCKAGKPIITGASLVVDAPQPSTLALLVPASEPKSDAPASGRCTGAVLAALFRADELAAHAIGRLPLSPFDIEVIGLAGPENQVLAVRRTQADMEPLRMDSDRQITSAVRVRMPFDVAGFPLELVASRPYDRLALENAAWPLSRLAAGLLLTGLFVAVLGTGRRTDGQPGNEGTAFLTVAPPPQISEDRFRLALSHSRVTVFGHEKDLRYAWCIGPLGGVPAENVVGRTDADLFQDRDAAALEAFKRGVLDSGVAERGEVVLSLGGDALVLDLDVEPYRDDGGNVAGIVCVAVDVTDNGRIRAELAAARHELGDTNVELADARSELAGAKAQLADAQIEMASVQAELGRDQADRANIKIDLAAANDQIGGIQSELDNAKVGFAGVRAELADTKAELANLRIELADARLAAERAVAAKSRFLVASSHDLRRSLQNVNLFRYILTRRLTTAEQRQAAVGLGEAVTSSFALLSSLLDASALEAGSVVPRVIAFDFKTMVSRLCDDTAKEAHARGLRMLFGPVATETVRSDPVLLERMIRILLGNALRYTEKGGILFGTRRRAGKVLIQVWDTGSGIPKEQCDLVFEDFFRGENQPQGAIAGIGLGLSVVRRLAQMLNHPISVRSCPGRGTVFTLAVPLAGGGDTPG